MDPLIELRTVGVQVDRDHHRDEGRHDHGNKETGHGPDRIERTSEQSLERFRVNLDAVALAARDSLLAEPLPDRLVNLGHVDADTEDQPAYFFGGSAFWKHAAVFCNFGFYGVHCNKQPAF